MLGLPRYVVHGAGGGGNAPSLNFNFVDGAAFSPQITFNRASSATLFDSSGTLVYAPMNLLTYSEDFGNPNWTKQSSVSVSTDTTIAPNGTTTADTITADSGSGIFQNITVTIGQRITQSLYLRAGTATSVMFRDDTGAGRHIVVNPSTGVVTSTSGTLIDFGSISMGNGWYRIYFSYAADTTLVRGIVRPDSAGAGQTFILWGAQTNFYPMQGGVTGDLSTYYPTTTAAYQGPRLDYDPATLAARGLLIEEQRTNLIFPSEDFANATYTPTNITGVVNAAVAPNGTTTADELVEDSALGVHGFLGPVVNVANATVYTCSIFAKVKAGTRSLFIYGQNVAAYLGANAGAKFNVSGAVISTGTTYGTSTSSVQSVGNGWYRCVVTFPATVAAAAAQNLRIVLDNGTGTPTGGADSYAGDGTSGFFVWGAQLEAGAFSTSYIPTTTIAATRAADVASVNTLSPWFNATEGTLYGEYSVYTSAGAKAIAQISDGTFNNRIQFTTTAGADPYAIVPRLVAGGVSTSPANTGSVAVGAFGKVALAYAIGANQGGVSVNGSAVNTSSPASAFSSVTVLELGKGLSLPQLSGYLRRITYYPRRLTDTQLQQITA